MISLILPASFKSTLSGRHWLLERLRLSDKRSVLEAKRRIWVCHCLRLTVIHFGLMWASGLCRERRKGMAFFMSAGGRNLNKVANSGQKTIGH